MTQTGRVFRTHKPQQTAGLKVDQDYFVEQFDDLFDLPL